MFVVLRTMELNKGQPKTWLEWDLDPRVNRMQTQHPYQWTTPPPKSIMNKIVTITILDNKQISKPSL